MFGRVGSLLRHHSLVIGVACAVLTVQHRKKKVSEFNFRKPFAFCEAAIEGASSIASSSKKEEQEEVQQLEEVLEVEEEEDDSLLDDDAWEAKKQSCSFCKFFLDSPCKTQFRDWSRCVDRCKKTEEDFKEACSPFTTALMECTDANAAYFSALNEGEQQEEDSIASSEVTEESIASSEVTEESIASSEVTEESIASSEVPDSQSEQQKEPAN